MVGGAPEQGLPGERDKDALDTSVPVLVEQLMSFSAWGVNKSIWRTFYTRSQGDPLCSLQLLGLSPRFFLEDAGLQRRMRRRLAQHLLDHTRPRAWTVRLLSSFLNWRLGEESRLGLWLAPGESDPNPPPRSCSRSESTFRQEGTHGVGSVT